MNSAARMYYVDKGGWPPRQGYNILGEDREELLAYLDRPLDMTKYGGIITSIPGNQGFLIEGVVNSDAVFIGFRFDRTSGVNPNNTQIKRSVLAKIAKNAVSTGVYGGYGVMARSNWSRTFEVKSEAVLQNETLNLTMRVN